MKQKAIIKVWGGVGNQLFIYSFARLLCSAWKGTVLLETRTGFQNDGYKRKFRLNEFSIEIGKISFFNTLFFFFERKIPFLKKIFFPNTSLVLEDESKKIKEISLLDLPSDERPVIYYQGYWQHLNFLSIREALLKELTFDLFPNNRFDEIRREIEASNAICLHVRRIQYDGYLSVNYYQDAIERIEQEVDSPHYFVFSDDIGWCKENIKTNSFCTFVDNFEDELYELKLMSYCRHFIIANSTFSWWGAWLSRNEDKKVVMPKGYLSDNMDGKVICL